jgi:myosin heavy subunit
MAEPDSKTLTAVIKEKDKEVKNLQKKVQKLEERYVQKHREQSDLTSDREALLSFARLVLESQISKSVGSVNFSELESAWISKDEEKQKAFNQFNKIASEEIIKLKNELNKFKEIVRVKEIEAKEFKSIEENLHCARGQIEEMQSEIEILEKDIENLRIENARLKSNHDEVNKSKTDALIKAMEIKSKEAVEESRLLKIIEESQVKISQLEQEIEKNVNSQIIIHDLEETLKHQISEKDLLSTKIKETEDTLLQVRSDFSDHRKKAQKFIMEKDQTIEKMKLKLKDLEKSDENDIIFNLKLRITELEKAQSRESVNLEYLKNIMMKFMEYIYVGNLKEADTLASVIYTVLDFSIEEIEIVRQARTSKVFLKGVKAMFSPVHSPGTGVSHNTLHTLEGRKRMNISLDDLSESSPR